MRYLYPVAGILLGCVAFAQPVPQQDSAGNIARQVRKVHEETAVKNAGLRFHVDWNSLAQYETPDRFRDAKFGIFVYWGVYSVPAFANEWYSRNMYIPGNTAYEHHVVTFAAPDKFGTRISSRAFARSSSMRISGSNCLRVQERNT